jgi:GTP cyclohydrolase IA
MNRNLNEISNAYRKLLELIGEDPDREGLADTPARAAKALDFITRGYDADIEEIVNGAIFESTVDDMVIVKDIELYSVCEHHLLPFLGRCHVGYIPTGKVIGLSKIPRIVDAYSSRLQIQENLTQQIARTVMEYTDAEGVGVVVQARHLCMMMRGVAKQNSVMTTSCMLGSFRVEPSTRNEFLSLIPLGCS